MVQIHSPRPLFPFPLIYLRTCVANLLDGICSARRATNAPLRLRDLRQLETESHFFRPLLAVIHVLDKLFPVACAHVRVFVTHPIINIWRASEASNTDSRNRRKAWKRTPVRSIFLPPIVADFRSFVGVGWFCSRCVSKCDPACPL